MHRFCEFKVVQTPLHLPAMILEDKGLDANHQFTWCGYTQKERIFVGEVIGFCYQGCLYLVSKLALHVVLPPLSLSSSMMRSESQGRWWFTSTDATDVFTQYESVLSIDSKRAQCQQWQIEVLDRALVYDGLKEAELLSSENGECYLGNYYLNRLQSDDNFFPFNTISRSVIWA